MILNTYESKNSRLVTGTKTKVETRIKKEKNKSSSSAIANLQTKTIHIRNAELFKITLSMVSKVFSYLLLLLLSVLFLLFILILHNTARRLLRRWGNSRERLRKENTLKCFSTRRRPAGRGCRSSLVWRTPSSLWNHTQQTVTSSSCAMRSPPSNCPTNESVVVTVLFVPEGLHLGDLFAALASDLVDVLGCGLHHFLHPLLLLLLLSSLKRTKAESFYSSGTTILWQ